MEQYTTLKLWLIISIISTGCFTTKKIEKQNTQTVQQTDTPRKEFKREHWRYPVSTKDSLNLMEKNMKRIISKSYYFEHNKFPSDFVRDSIYNLKLPFDTVKYYKQYDEFNKAGKTFAD
jgi:hypothetical protein